MPYHMYPRAIYLIMCETNFCLKGIVYYTIIVHVKNFNMPYNYNTLEVAASINIIPNNLACFFFFIVKNMHRICTKSYHKLNKTQFQTIIIFAKHVHVGPVKETAHPYLSSLCYDQLKTATHSITLVVGTLTYSDTQVHCSS